MTFQWRHVMWFLVKNGRQLYRSQINVYRSKSQKKMPRQSKLNSLQDGCLRFSNVLDLAPKFQKTMFSGKSALKFKIVKIFKKNTYYMYRTYIRVFSMPSCKFVSQVWPPNDCNKCEMWWRHKYKSHFWGIYRHLTQKQIASLDFWDKTELEKCVLFPKFSISKMENFDPFWPFLTWTSG